MYKMIKGIKEYWSSSPLWGKVVWVISIFLSSGSIASLSDLIFSWKGFILDAVVFYRKIIDPIHQALYFIFELKPTSIDIDLIVIFGLFFSAYSKFKVQFLLNSRKDIKRTPWLYIRAIFAFTLIWSVTILFASYGVISNAGYIYMAFVIIIFMLSALYPISIIGMGMDILPEIEECDPKCKEKMLRIYSNRYSVLYIPYYGPIVISITLVAVLAAINVGLEKPI